MIDFRDRIMIFLDFLITQCDHLCGPGKQTRRVTCYTKVDGKIQVLEDEACEGDVPEREKPCELRPCAGLDWVTSDWSGVSPQFFTRYRLNLSLVVSFHLKYRRK